ncbi:MAG: ergothioneine biosynthesis protein EgtB [Acidobacteria bacterium]|nr:ergothioneine biosynthesis protein EgtB [Acidobacteriota bacterium]
MSTSANKAQKLLAALERSRAATDELFRIVKPQALYDRPIPERHRIVFYIGHLEAFDWNLLGKFSLNLKSFHEGFDRLFAFGIDPVDGGLPSDQPSEWPRIPEVEAYRDKVRSTLDSVLARASFSGPSESLLLNVAIEHRLMHAETLAYMFHQLPLEHKFPQTDAPLSVLSKLQLRMVEIPAGPATLGLTRNETFGWDNEFEMHIVVVPAFAIENHKVTNEQFFKFLEAGGYEEARLWSKENWDWIKQQEIRYPVFWTKRGSEWRYRTMFDEVPLPLDWPVYVSHAEASAYAKWAGKALPTEAQWHRAALGTREGRERAYPWSAEAPAARHGNFDFQRWDPAPVGAFPAGDSAFGVAELVGNGWEWTSSIFEPFQGFEPFPFYPGYSANFFDGKHYVMKGGSGRTAACMLRRSFRTWFQGHYQYIYAGFRCVEN